MSSTFDIDGEDSSSSDSSEDGEEYRTEGLKKLSHGFNFQQHVSAMVILRALERGLKFRAGVEEEAAGKFDDLVIRTQDSGSPGVTTNTLMQMKHRDMKSPSSEEKFITVKDLKKVKGNYSLPEYFKSFLGVFKEFSGEGKTLRHCVIVTNLGFNPEDEVSTWVEVEKDYSGREVVDELLGVSLWRFRASFEGRQELIKTFSGLVKGNKVEIGNTANIFLEKLRFAVKMKECEGLIKLQKAMLRKIYPTLRRRSIYNEFILFIQKWFFNEKGIYLTDHKIKGHLESLRNKLGTVRMSVLDPVRNFTGRARELDDIKGFRDSGEKAVVICGMGGIGKTQLAMMFLKKCLDDENSTIWFDGRSKETMRESFYQLANILGVSRRRGRDEVNFGELLEKIGGCFRKTKCVLVMDNVRSREMIYEEGFLNVFPEGCFFLVTTRMRNWGCIKMINLEVMPKEEAMNLLKESLSPVNKVEDESDLVYLAKKLGYLPLALQQAISFLNTLRRNNSFFYSDDKPSTCSNLYHSRMWQILEQSVDKSLGDNYKETVASTWIQSIEDINKNQSYSTAIPLLNTIAYLSPKKTLLDELKAVAKDVGGNVYTDLLALNDCSMINLCRGQIACHILLQAVMRSRLHGEEKELDVIERALDAYNDFRVDNQAILWKHAFSHNEFHRRCISVLNSLIESLLGVHRFSKALKIAKNTLEKILIPLSESECEIGKRVIECLNDLVRKIHAEFYKIFKISKFWEMKKHNPLNEIFHPLIIRKSKVLVKAKELYDSKLEIIGSNLAQKFNIELKKGIKKAMMDTEAMEEILTLLSEWMEKSKGRDIEGYMLALESTSRILFILGKDKEALDSYKKLENCLKNRHPKNTISSLAMICHIVCILKRLNRPDEAKGLSSKVESCISSLSGKEFRAVATLKEVAEMFLFHDVHEMALKTYEKLYELQALNSGTTDEKHRLDTTSSIVDIHLMLNRNQEALKSLQAIQKVQLKMLERNDVRLIETKKVTFACYLKLNQVPEALRVCEELSKPPFPKNAHLDSQISKMKFITGVYLFIMTEFRKALEIFEDVYESVVKNFGFEHEVTYKVKKWIGLSLMNMGEHERAKDIFDLLHAKDFLANGVKDEKSVNDCFLFANCLFECREFEKALEIFRKLSHDECKDEYHKMLGRYFEGRCLLKLGDVPLAMDIFKDVCTKNLQFPVSNITDVLGVNESIANELCEYGRYSEALDISKKVYEAQLRNKLDHSNILVNIGKCLLPLGDSNGLKFMEKAYEDKVSSGGVEHPEAMKMLFDIGVVLSNHPEMLDKATKIFEDIHEMKTRIYGVDQPDTLDTKLMIGMCYWIGKEYSKAKVIFEEVYAKRSFTLGQKHAETLCALGMIASFLMESGNFSKALEYLHELYETRVVELGSEHEDMMMARKLMAKCLLEMKRPMDALGHLKDIVDSRNKIMGCAHPETIDMRILYAHCLSQMNYKEEALEIYKDVQRIRANSLRNVDAESLCIEVKIGHLHFEMGELEKAFEVLKGVLNNRLLMLGEDHQDVLKTRFKIGFCLVELGKHQEAMMTYEHVYRKSHDVLGADHRMTLDARFMIGVCLFHLGDRTKSLKLLRVLHKKMVRVLGRNDILTFKCLRFKGLCLKTMGEYKKALDCFEEAHKGLVATEGEDFTPAVLTLYDTLVCMFQLGLKKKSIKLALDLYDRRRLLSDPPKYIRFQHVGDILASLSEHAKALEVFKEVNGYRGSSLGQEHELTLDSKISIGFCLFFLDKHVECLGVIKEVVKVSNVVANQLSEILRGMGLKLVHLGQTQMALRFFQEAYDRISTIPEMETSLEAAESYSFLLIYRKEAGIGFLKYVMKSY